MSSALIEPLSRRYDVALLDLDGVVYIGRRAVTGAPAHLAAARRDGMRLAFVTNNAARTPEVVAAHLGELGIAAEPADVVTSGQAAGRYLAENLPPRANVLVLGTQALAQALVDHGLTPVDTADKEPAAVVQGYSPDLGWRELAEGAVAINAGALWVASNADRTLPSDRGPLPANGSLVAALTHATGRVPVVVGKPHPALHRESLERSGARRPLVVGDRLDTDIEGANAAGCDSLLVFSGSTRPADLLLAPGHRRPTYLAADVGGLLHPHPAPVLVDGQVRCGNWTARVVDGGVELESAPVPADVGDEELDPLRALVIAAWAAGEPPVRIGAGTAAAVRALRCLGLQPSE